MTLFNYARVSYPPAAGGWLVLSAAPYSLADGTMETWESKMEKITAKSPFYDGEWTVQATSSNDEWPLAVRCQHASSLNNVFNALMDLKHALQQQTYTVDMRLGNWSQLFTCFAADISIQTDKPLLHATQGVIKATMSAIPT